MKGKRFRERTINYWLLGIIIVLLAVISLVSMAYIKANRPMTQAKSDAVKVAKKYANLKKVDQFYWFNREKTYFTVTGKNDMNRDVVVIIPKSGDKIRLLEQKDGLTENQIRQQMGQQHSKMIIEKVTLGIYHDQTAWEVSAKNKAGEMSYYLFDYKSGKEIKVVKNL